MRAETGRSDLLGRKVRCLRQGISKKNKNGDLKLSRYRPSIVRQKLGRSRIRMGVCELVRRSGFISQIVQMQHYLSSSSDSPCIATAGVHPFSSPMLLKKAQVADPKAVPVELQGKSITIRCPSTLVMDNFKLPNSVYPVLSRHLFSGHEIRAPIGPALLQSPYSYVPHILEQSQQDTPYSRGGLVFEIGARQPPRRSKNNSTPAGSNDKALQFLASAFWMLSRTLYSLESLSATKKVSCRFAAAPLSVP
jgi:hypothetical protein